MKACEKGFQKPRFGQIVCSLTIACACVLVLLRHLGHEGPPRDNSNDRVSVESLLEVSSPHQDSKDLGLNRSH
jgi:hypothetical protein